MKAFGIANSRIPFRPVATIDQGFCFHVGAAHSRVPHFPRRGFGWSR